MLRSSRSQAIEPLRGYKLNTLEGGIRVPFAVQWTGHLPANTIYDQPVSALDIVATAAAAAHVALPNDRDYDGWNLIPYLSGQQIAPERTFYWRWFGLGGQTGPPGSVDTIYAVRQGPLKLIVERGGSTLPAALYNLDDDIRENHDLALTQPDDAASLKALYDQWNSLDRSAPLAGSERVSRHSCPGRGLERVQHQAGGSSLAIDENYCAWTTEDAGWL